ncbi:MAG: O-antigen/teichoic acid export membrane protein [Bdellovibrionota bacterium]|jgi:O-antigen/teichoic acid export membrane protein
MSIRLFKKLPLLLEQSVFSGTGFMINIALVKLLGLEQYGILASLIIFSHLLLSISQALVIQPMQVHISKAKALYSYRFILLGLQLSLILFYLIVIMGISLADFTSVDFGRAPLLPFTLYLATFILYDFYRKYFLATGRVTTALIIGMIYSASTISLLLLTLSNQSTETLTTYLYVLMAGYLPALTVASVVYCQALALPGKDTLIKYLKIHLIDGQWLLYAAVVQWFSGNLYVMMSGLLIGIEALGVLRFIQSLFGLINILLQTIENYVLPQLSRAYQVSLQHSYQAFQKSLGAYQLAILGGLALLFFFAEEVLRLAGSAEFVPYAYVLRGMVFLYVIIIVAYPIRLLIRITELNKSYFAAYLISFLFSLLSYQFLLTHFGVTGAVLGLIINQLILQATWLIVLHKNQFNVWKLYTS